MSDTYKHDPMLVLGQLDNHRNLTPGQNIGNASKVGQMVGEEGSEVKILCCQMPAHP